jgi:flagellar hook-length control protein FliK
MATVDKPPPRKGGAQHAQAAAAAGASLPPPGNAAPRPAIPAPIPAAPALPVLGLPALAGGSPPAGAAAVASSADLKITTASVAGASGAAPPAARDPSGAGRPALPNPATAPDDANPVASPGPGYAPIGAEAAAAPAPDTLAAAASVAAAAADDRLAAMPADEGQAPTAKGPMPNAANGGDGLGSTAAALEQQSGAAATAPIVAALAMQNSGAADKRSHDSAAGAPGESPVDAAASLAAAAANVRDVSGAQGATPMLNSTPATPEVNSPQFPDQIAAHVSYLVDQNLNGATLQVNPPQLGPIELRVSVEAGHAQVWLSAHSAATCDALQQSSSKLRDLLASQGFGQVSVDISQRSFQDRSTGAQTYVWSGSAEPVPETTAAAAQIWSPRTPTGVLDAYA